MADPQRTRERLIEMVLEAVQTQGPSGALWAEADGDSGHLVRADGQLLPLGDYQEDGDRLQDLSKPELARLLGHLTPWNVLETEAERRLSAAQVAWLTEGGDYTPGPELYYSGFKDEASYPTTVRLTQDAVYRDEDGALHTVPAGTTLAARGPHGDDPNVAVQDPLKARGMSLLLPPAWFDAVDLKPTGRGPKP